MKEYIASPVFHLLSTLENATNLCKRSGLFSGQTPSSLVMAFCAVHLPTLFSLSSYLTNRKQFICCAHLWAQHSG